MEREHAGGGFYCHPGIRRHKYSTTLILIYKRKSAGGGLRLSERTYSAGKAVMAKEWEVFVGKMELEKRTIYMDRMKYKAGTQIALEDDRNLQDNKPDIKRVSG